MSDPYQGEIRMFGGNYAPRNWTFCNGQLLAIAQYQAIFSLLGTTYGGDGRSSFGIPDMRGRLPLQNGDGPGLTPRPIGQRAGTETVALGTDEIPNHTHLMQVSADNASLTDFSGAVPARQYIYEDVPGSIKQVDLRSGTIGTTGAGQGHQNLMPYLCVSFILCMEGLYPSRN